MFLSLKSKFTNQQVNRYLQNNDVWACLMIEHFFVSRKLNGKTFRESFRAIQSYCLESNNLFDDQALNNLTTTPELTRN